MKCSAKIEARSELRHFRVADLVCDGAPDHDVYAIREDQVAVTRFRQLIESHSQVLLRLAAQLVAIIRPRNERLAELGSFDEEVRRIHQELFLITL